MITQGDCLAVLPTLDPASVQCCVTSPPYWGLRDYAVEGQLGQEGTPEAYVARLVEVFEAVRRVLRDDGTLWLNLGDCYSKSKDLVGIPWRVAFALQAVGWRLRCDIIWNKPNPMPESVTDRPTKAHEYVFLFAKRERYFYDAEAIAEPVSAAMIEQLQQGYSGTAKKNYADAGAQDPSAVKKRILSRAGNKARKYGDDVGRPGHARGVGVPWEGFTRNKRSVWTITTQSFPEAHFATFPEALVEPCVLAGSRQGDLVLDPFCGSGTVGMFCVKAQRRFLGIDINPTYVAMADRRVGGVAPLFTEAAP